MALHPKPLALCGLWGGDNSRRWTCAIKRASLSSATPARQIAGITSGMEPPAYGRDLAGTWPGPGNPEPHAPAEKFPTTDPAAQMPGSGATALPRMMLGRSETEHQPEFLRWAEESRTPQRSNVTCASKPYRTQAVFAKSLRQGHCLGARGRRSRGTLVVTSRTSPSKPATQLASQFASAPQTRATWRGPDGARGWPPQLSARSQRSWRLCVCVCGNLGHLRCHQRCQLRDHSRHVVDDNN